MLQDVSECQRIENPFKRFSFRAFKRVSVLQGISLNGDMVEAAGIEPASVSTPPLVLHA